MVFYSFNSSTGKHEGNINKHVVSNYNNNNNNNNNDNDNNDNSNNKNNLYTTVI